MFAKTARYLTALLVLSVLAFGYELTVVPFLEPPPVASVAIEQAAMISRSSLVDELFPEGSWQRKAPRRLKTETGFLLFSHREQISTDRWRVWPVTVIVADPGKPPIVLNAIEGAEIAFAEPLDVLSHGAPPIESGQLRGNVSIRTMSRADGKPVPVAEQWEIAATDVGIDRRRIWTHEKIRLRWGETVLAGRNLTLQLAGGGAIPTDGIASPTSILDSMQLVYLDELSIPIADASFGGRATASAGDGKEGAQNVAKNQAASDGSAGSKISVHCEGTVSFDFATDTLELRNQVRLEHHVPGRPSDSVQCHSLRIKFNNPLASNLPRESASDWLREIEATGEPVLAKLPSLDSEAAAERIIYDAEKGRFRMHGPGGVRISYRGMNLKTTEFDYTVPADDPRRVGTLEAAGSGLISFQDTATSALRRLRWNKGLRLHPLEPPREHELLVSGDVRAALVDGGSIEADVLAFRFLENEVAEDQPADDQPADDQAADDQATEEGQPESPFARLTPKNAQATGKVKLDTSTLFTETDDLQLFFNVKPALPESPEEQLSLNPASGSPIRFWVKQPEDAEAGQPRGTDPVARPIPKLFGKKVRAQVTLVERQVVGGDLSVEGDVRLEHEMVTEQATLPVVVSGEQLRVIHDQGKQLVHMVGGKDPAKFDLGDGFFVGPVIKIDVKDNYVWIQDGGSFRMPSAVMPHGDPQATVRWASAPRCDWSGEMLFDGREVELSGGVRLTAEMLVGQDDAPWNMAATGERLRIRLDQEIRIGDPQKARAASVRDLALLGDPEHPVYLTADEAGGDGRLVTRHVLCAPVLTVLPSSGGLVGEGPGWYRQWTVSAGEGALAQFAPAGTLIGTHLVFQAEMVGDLRNRRLDFVRDVRIGVRPVERWEELVDVQQMESLGMGQATIACDRLSFVQAPEAAAAAATRGDQDAASGPADPLGAWEMLAQGGVAFRARNDRGLFEGTAARASYAAVKDLFVVEGDGRRAAHFQRTYPTGLPGPTIDLPYLAIRPRAGVLVDSTLQGAAVGTLPNQRPQR